MSKTAYTNYSEVNELQTNIMKFVDIWVHEKKTPVPLKEIILNMTGEGIKYDTTVKAIKALVKKGFIRRSYMISNKTYFTQLRRV